MVLRVASSFVCVFVCLSSAAVPSMLDQMVRTDEEDFNKLLAFALDKKPHTPLQLDKPKIYKICQAASEYITLHVDLVFEDFLTTYDEGNHQFAVFLAKET